MFLVVMTDCLSFFNYHVGLVIQWPNSPLGESFDFKLFILVCEEFNSSRVLSSRQYPIDGHV